MVFIDKLSGDADSKEFLVLFLAVSEVMESSAKSTVAGPRLPSFEPQLHQMLTVSLDRLLSLSGL